MKTQNEILTDVYEVVKATPIADLDGGIYKNIRPTSSVKEDCVINLVSGSVAKFIRDGAIYIKIFYKDIFLENAYYEDTLRCQFLEGLLFDLSEILLKSNDYSFDIQSRELYSEKVELINQHFVILKLNFQLIM